MAEQARRQGSQIPGWDSERLTTLFSRGICRLNVPFDVFFYVCEHMKRPRCVYRQFKRSVEQKQGCALIYVRKQSISANRGRLGAVR